MTIQLQSNEIINGNIERVQSEVKPVDVVEKTEVINQDQEKVTESVDAEKPRDKLQKRFDDLTKAREDAKRALVDEQKRRESLEAEIASLRSGKEKTGRPNPNDFENAFEYAEALSEWKIDKIFQEKESKREVKKFEESQNKAFDTFQSKMELAKTEIDDYDEVVNNSSLSVSNIVRDAIVESDIGPELIYHLAKNPGIVKDINEASTTKALKMIGKLEVKLAKEETKEVKAVEKKVTSAPKPISPIKSKTTSANMVDSDGVFTGSFAEFKELRRSGKLK